MTTISYDLSEIAWNGHEDFILDLIERFDVKSICDIGGGANPILSLDRIRQFNLDYAVLDISPTELEKCGDYPRKIVADIASPNFRTEQKFDLVFSKMLAEHVHDAESFHRNVLELLSDRGIAFHFFPTLYAFPFIINKLIPEALSAQILRFAARRDEYQRAKFPAYYRWCRGPTKRQIRRFVDIGFDVVQFIGFFGHSPYYQKIPIAMRLHEWKSRFLVRHPNPHLTSVAYLVLQRSS